MGQEEKERVVGSDQQDQETKLLEVVAEEEEEESKETMRGGGGDAADCDNCGGAAAAVYCRADTARLCLTCDRDVHGANAVCSRHARAPLCGACRGAGAVFRRHAAGAGAGGFLCSNCDFARHRHGEVPPHDRCTVQGYTGCPSAHELAALLGLADFEKPAAAAGAHEGGGWWDIWEEPHVFSLEDLIVPTTSCHDFQPLLTPSSPKRKNQSSMDGKTNVEIIAQLGEIAKLDGGTENGAYDQEAEQGAGDQLLSWAPSQFITGHGNFGTENNNEVGIMPTPGYENGGWDNSDYHVLNDQCKVEFTYEQAPVSSGEACMSSFVHMSEICPGMSNGSSMEDNPHTDPGIGVPMQVLPKRAGPEYVTCADRSSVITRYKEKRKTRRFDKQVRYESRKARADSRLRVKGRFAKANQN